jgi:hypothetical protein
VKSTCPRKYALPKFLSLTRVQPVGVLTLLGPQLPVP